MSANINTFTFEYWDGPPPQLPTRKSTINHRPGVSGVSHQILGTWGDTFTVMLTSHHVSLTAASDFYRSLTTDLVGKGRHYLTWETINWSSDYGVLYHVESVELVDLRSHLYLIGPTYSYANGASLTVRMTLTPEAT